MQRRNKVKDEGLGRRLIVADANIPGVEDYFGQQAELVLLPGREINPADVKEADVLLVRSITPVNEFLLAGSRVKFVGSVTSGTDHLDCKYLAKRKIAWANVSGFNAQAVADYVVSAVAALQKQQLLLGKKRAAVIGVGKVGSKVARHLETLGFEVLLCDPVRAKNEKNFKSRTLNKIKNMDLVSIHTPLSFEGEFPTYHMIDADFLKRQKSDTVIINAARGAVMDTGALIEHGAHLHACLDVFEHEPKVSRMLLEYALLATPHIAGYSVQSKLRGVQTIYKSALEYKIISRAKTASLNLPEQTLDFAGDQHTWQDVVLSVFNPFMMTALMRANLMASDDSQKAFDELRHQFNFRYEFAFTKLTNINLSNEDLQVVKQLGFKL